MKFSIARPYGFLLVVVSTGCSSGSERDWRNGDALTQIDPTQGCTTPSGPTKLNPPDTYVQLFKWRWNDIATECTRFLGPSGFGAVQISPPQASVTRDAWWNVYQPVSYQNLVSDMGNAEDLKNMVSACHSAGVRVYADAVFNQQAAGSGTGTDGSSYSQDDLRYPEFGSSDFHSACDIQSSDYNDNRARVVECRLVGMPDLALEKDEVRSKISQYLTSLVQLGVDGFRVDAAKHMWPADLQAILTRVPRTTSLGEPLFVIQEVIPDGTVNRSDYFMNGTINEFPFTYALRDTFRNKNGHDISELPAILGTGDGGGSWKLAPSANVTVFVDNHDTERSHTDSLNLQDDNNGSFVLANIFMLTQPYGRAQLQSGFVFPFSNTDQNAPTASPYNGHGDAIIMGAWDFVHRWSNIYPLVSFRSSVSGEAMTKIQSDGHNHLAFGRGAKGFVALNNDRAPWTASLHTDLPAGTYCNIVHGLLANGGTACAKDSVTVDASGTASFHVEPLGSDLAAAVVLSVAQKTR